MKVRVKLFATLRKYLPTGTAGGDTLTVDVPDGSVVRDAIAALGIPAEHARVIVWNNEQLQASSLLHDGQEINLFPPMAGGR
jgi:molybdopterin converting factor small subunit